MTISDILQVLHLDLDNLVLQDTHISMSHNTLTITGTMTQNGVTEIVTITYTDQAGDIVASVGINYGDQTLRDLAQAGLLPPSAYAMNELPDITFSDVTATAQSEVDVINLSGQGPAEGLKLVDNIPNISNPTLNLSVYVASDNSLTNLQAEVKGVIRGLGNLPITLSLPRDWYDWEIHLQPDNQTTFSDLTGLAVLWGTTWFENVSLLDLLPANLPTQAQDAFQMSQLYMRFNTTSQVTYVSSFVLNAATPWAIVPGYLEVTSFSLNSRLERMTNPAGVVQNTNISGQIAGEINLLGTTLAFTIPYPPGQLSVLRLTPAFDLYDGIGQLSELVADLTGNADLTTVLPETFTIPNLGVRFIEIAFNPLPAEATLKYISFQIETQEPWSLPYDESEILVLTQIVLQLTVTNPLSNNNRLITGRLGGIFTLGSAYFGVVIERPSGQDNWTLKIASEDVVASVADIGQLFGIAPADLTTAIPTSLSILGTLGIYNLRLIYDFSEQTLNYTAFGITTTAPWEIIPDYIVVDEANLNFDIYTPLSPNRSITTFISTQLTLAGAVFVITAGNNNRSSGWQLKGTLTADTQLNLTALINDFLTLLIPGTVLPDGFPVVSLTAAEARLTTDTGALYLSGATQIAWQPPFGKYPDDPPFLLALLNVTFDMGAADPEQADKRPYVFSAAGHFEFSSIEANVAFATSNNVVDTVLVGQISTANAQTLSLPEIANQLQNNDDANPTWTELVPTVPANLSDFNLNAAASLGINLTRNTFLLAGMAQLSNNGPSGSIAFLFGQQPDTTWGFFLAMSLQNFQFADLIPALSIIDQYLHVRQVSFAISTFSNTSVQEVIDSFNQLPDIDISPQDQFNQIIQLGYGADEVAELGVGANFYAQLDFGTTLFGNILTFLPTFDESADLTLYALFDGVNPENTRFTAWFGDCEVLQIVQFNSVRLDYRPNLNNQLNLTGQMVLTFTGTPYTFDGAMQIDETQGHFELSTPSNEEIVAPIGMFGITFQDLSLKLDYLFSPTSSLTLGLAGTVSFGPLGVEPTSPEVVTLNGQILFVDNLTPAVVDIALAQPLPLLKFFATCFGQEWPDDLVDITLMQGAITYYDPDQDATHIYAEQYVTGFNIHSAFEILGIVAVIDINVISTGLTAQGMLANPITIGDYVSFTDLSFEHSPSLSLTVSEEMDDFSMQCGFIFFGNQFATGEASIQKIENNEAQLWARFIYVGEVDLFKDSRLTFTYSQRDGFQVQEWPFAFLYALDYARYLNSLSKGECGAIVDMIFDNTVSTKFNVNLGMTINASGEAVATLTGTYSLTLLEQAQKTPEPFLYVEMPPLHITISLSTISLDHLASWVIDQIADNAESIISQLFSDPAKFTTFITVVGIGELSQEVVTRLVCNGGEEGIEGEEAIEEAEAGQAEAEEALSELEETIEPAAESASELAEGAETIEAGVEALETMSTVLGEASVVAETALVGAAGVAGVGLGGAAGAVAAAGAVVAGGAGVVAGGGAAVAAGAAAAAGVAAAAAAGVLLGIAGLALGAAAGVAALGGTAATAAAALNVQAAMSINNALRLIARASAISNQADEERAEEIAQWLEDHQTPSEGDLDDPTINSFAYDDGKVTVDWDDITHATAYEIELRNSLNLAVSTQYNSAFSTTASFSSAGLAAGDYHAWIKALAFGYESSTASSASITKLSDPDAPSLVYNAQTDTLEANWSPDGQAVGYQVALYQDGGRINTAAVSGTSKTFSATNLDPARYTVRLRLTGDDSHIPGDWSEASSPVVKLAQPTVDSLVYQASKVIVTLHPSSDNPAGYTVRLVDEGGSRTTAVSTVNNIAQFEATDLGAGTYHPEASALAANNQAISSDWAQQSSQTISKLDEPVVSQVTCSAETNQITVTLGTPVSGASQYTLQLITANNQTNVGDPVTITAGAIPIQTTISITGLAAGQYKVKSQAVGDGNQVIPSDWTTASNMLTRLEQPTISSFAYNAQTAQVVVTWTPIEDATIYQLQLLDGSNEPVGAVINVPLSQLDDSQNPSYGLDGGTFPLENCRITVRASSDNTQIIPSTWATNPTTLARLGSPQISQAVFDAVNQVITVTLVEAVPGATSYTVQLLNSQTQVVVSNVPVDEQTLQAAIPVTTLTAETYLPQAQALADNEQVIPSDWQDSPQTLTRLAAPTIGPMGYILAANQIEVNFSEIELATSYQFYLLNNQNQPIGNLVSLTATEAQANNYQVTLPVPDSLATGSCNVEGRAIATDPHLISSLWQTAATPLTRLNQPAITALAYDLTQNAVDSAENAITVTWQSISGIRTYQLQLVNGTGDALGAPVLLDDPAYLNPNVQYFETPYPLNGQPPTGNCKVEIRATSPDTGVIASLWQPSTASLLRLDAPKIEGVLIKTATIQVSLVDLVPRASGYQVHLLDETETPVSDLVAVDTNTLLAEIPLQSVTVGTYTIQARAIGERTAIISSVWQSAPIEDTLTRLDTPAITHLRYVAARQVVQVTFDGVPGGLLYHAQLLNNQNNPFGQSVLFDSTGQNSPFTVDVPVTEILPAGNCNAQVQANTTGDTVITSLWSDPQPNLALTRLTEPVISELAYDAQVNEVVVTVAMVGTNLMYQAQLLNNEGALVNSPVVVQSTGEAGDLLTINLPVDEHVTPGLCRVMVRATSSDDQIITSPWTISNTSLTRLPTPVVSSLLYETATNTIQVSFNGVDDAMSYGIQLVDGTNVPLNQPVMVLAESGHLTYTATIFIDQTIPAGALNIIITALATDYISSQPSSPNPDDNLTRLQVSAVTNIDRNEATVALTVTFNPVLEAGGYNLQLVNGLTALGEPVYVAAEANQDVLHGSIPITEDMPPSEAYNVIIQGVAPAENAQTVVPSPWSEPDPAFNYTRLAPPAITAITTTDTIATVEIEPVSDALNYNIQFVDEANQPVSQPAAYDLLSGQTQMDLHINDDLPAGNNRVRVQTSWQNNLPHTLLSPWGYSSQTVVQLDAPDVTDTTYDAVANTLNITLAALVVGAVAYQARFHPTDSESEADDIEVLVPMPSTLPPILVVPLDTLPANNYDVSVQATTSTPNVVASTWTALAAPFGRLAAPQLINLTYNVALSVIEASWHPVMEATTYTVQLLDNSNTPVGEPTTYHPPTPTADPLGTSIPLADVPALPAGPVTAQVQAITTTPNMLNSPWVVYQPTPLTRLAGPVITDVAYQDSNQSIQVTFNPVSQGGPTYQLQVVSNLQPVSQATTITLENPTVATATAEILVDDRIPAGFNTVVIQAVSDNQQVISSAWTVADTASTLFRLPVVIVPEMMYWGEDTVSVIWLPNGSGPDTFQVRLQDANHQPLGNTVTADTPTNQGYFMADVPFNNSLPIGEVYAQVRALADNPLVIASVPGISVDHLVRLAPPVVSQVSYMNMSNILSVMWQNVHEATSYKVQWLKENGVPYGPPVSYSISQPHIFNSLDEDEEDEEDEEDDENDEAPVYALTTPGYDFVPGKVLVQLTAQTLGGTYISSIWQIADDYLTCLNPPTLSNAMLDTNTHIVTVTWHSTLTPSPYELTVLDNNGILRGQATIFSVLPDTQQIATITLSPGSPTTNLTVTGRANTFAMDDTPNQQIPSPWSDAIPVTPAAVTCTIQGTLFFNKQPFLVGNKQVVFVIKNHNDPHGTSPQSSSNYNPANGSYTISDLPLGIYDVGVIVREPNSPFPTAPGNYYGDLTSVDASEGSLTAQNITCWQIMHLTAPSNNAQKLDFVNWPTTFFNFVWTTVTNASYYHILIQENNNGNLTTVYDLQLTTLTAQTNLPVNVGLTYYQLTITAWTSNNVEIGRLLVTATDGTLGGYRFGVGPDPIGHQAQLGFNNHLSATEAAQQLVQQFMAPASLDQRSDVKRRIAVSMVLAGYTPTETVTAVNIAIANYLPPDDEPTVTEIVYAVSTVVAVANKDKLNGQTANQVMQNLYTLFYPTTSLPDISVAMVIGEFDPQTTLSALSTLLNTVQLANESVVAANATQAVYAERTKIGLAIKYRIQGLAATETGQNVRDMFSDPPLFNVPSDELTDVLLQAGYTQTDVDEAIANIYGR